MNVTAYDLMQRFLGQTEGAGASHNPLIQWGFVLCGMSGDTPDEVPWCSAIMQIPFFMLGLPRSKSAAARSWLTVGVPVELTKAKPGFDVCVFSRGSGPQPGPDVIAAPGHVTLFAGVDSATGNVLGLGGNQGDKVCIAHYDPAHLLGIRRLGGA